MDIKFLLIIIFIIAVIIGFSVQFVIIIRRIVIFKDKVDEIYDKEFLEKIEKGEQEIKEYRKYLRDKYKTWTNVNDELPPISNDKSGFGDIHSKDVIVKDIYDNYDIKKYDHLAMKWMGGRDVIPKFWKDIE